MTTLITNLKDSLLIDAITQMNADEVIFIQEEPYIEDLNSENNTNLNSQCDSNSPLSHLIFPDNVKIESKSVALDNLNQNLQKLDVIISDTYENGSEVYFALEGNLLGLQILEAAKKFNIKKIYVDQAGKLKEFKACYIKGF